MLAAGWTSGLLARFLMGPVILGMSSALLMNAEAVGCDGAGTAQG